MIKKMKRLMKLSFYLGLGGISALASSCSSSFKRSGRDAAVPPTDSGTYTPDASKPNDTANGDRRDAQKPPIENGASILDAGKEPSDGGEGGNLWDVVYE